MGRSHACGEAASWLDGVANDIRLNILTFSLNQGLRACARGLVGRIRHVGVGER